MQLEMCAVLLALMACLSGLYAEHLSSSVVRNTSGEVSSRALEEDRCQLRIIPTGGACNSGWDVRYGFNHRTKKCEAFMSRSCAGGNENNFASRKECLETCFSRSLCLLKKGTGLPLVGAKSYIYDADSDLCKPARKVNIFKKTAYWPEDNRFQTPEECQAECMPTL
uniref:BPTI/Kunitz inhibitor domain-containing protein n=1 Tax=Amblyomma maculatum TaxID=34609 RepID=G3MSA3_AMBMU